MKATKEKRWGKVKGLQRLLTHSFSGKALAVTRVTENQGKNTPGVDKVTREHSTQEDRRRLRASATGVSSPTPPANIHPQEKRQAASSGNSRHAHAERCRRCTRLSLDPVAETTADPNSYGFRPQRSTADAIEQCFNVLGKRTSPQWILEGDIKGCFDAIAHEWLLAHIPMDKRMLKKWLEAGYMEQRILSPVLAHMTLDGLERVRYELFRPTTVAGRRAKVHLIRYADDARDRE